MWIADARNVARARIPLSVLDGREVALAEAKSFGAVPPRSVGELAARWDIVSVVVSDDDDLNAVLDSSDGLLPQMAGGAR